jgi:hypothetical protein
VAKEVVELQDFCIPIAPSGDSAEIGDTQTMHMATHDQWQGETYWVLGERGLSGEPDLGMTSPGGLSSKATSEWPHDS